MAALPSSSSMFRRAVVSAMCGALVGALAPAGHAGQARSVTDRVYADAQAARGQAAYTMQCVVCHGASLEGIVGPPLAGAAFLSVWSKRSLAELVDKIEKTMPPTQPGSLSRPQAIDLAAYVLNAGKFPAGPTELTAATLSQIAFPEAAAASTPSSATPSGFTPTGNLAQVMRGITFPNANIRFYVQVKEPGKE